MKFRSLIRSNLYQLLHSGVGILHLIIPLVGVIIFIGYDAITTMSPEDQISLYIEGLVLVFPLVIAGLTAMLSEMEAKAGTYQMLLMTPGHKNRPHSVKLLILIVFGSFSTAIALIGFGMGFSLLGHWFWSWTFWLVLATLLFISMIPIYILSYSVSFLMGKGYGLGLGIVGSLLNALLMTGLGDTIWYFLPWGVASHLSMTFLRMDFADFHDTYSVQLNQGLLGLVLMTALFLMLKQILFEKWEGKKSDD